MSIKAMVSFGLTLIAALLGLLIMIQPDGLTVHFISVGGGEAILIRGPAGQDILIDGGGSEAIVSALGRIMPFYDRTIETLIITHPHADHITGLPRVLADYQVERVYLSGAVHTSSIYLELLGRLRDAPETQKIKVDHQFSVAISPDLRLEFIYPDFDVAVTDHPFIKDNLNNTSVVVRVTYKEQSFLFVGDIEAEVEAYLVKSSINNFILRSDTLKVGHQGSKTSSSLEFLQAVAPQTAVIIVDANNRYGHPHPEVIKRLNELGIKILRTDKDGDIMLEY